MRIIKFDKDGNVLKEWGSGEDAFNYPHSVYVTDEEKVWVCDRNKGRIQVFNTDGKHLETWNDFLKPYGARSIDNEEFIVAEGTKDRFTKISKDGTILGYQEGRINNAHSIAYDPTTGDLVTGMYSGTVVRWKAP